MAKWNMCFSLYGVWEVGGGGGGGGMVKKTTTISCLIGEIIKIIIVSVLWKTRCTIALVLISSIVHQVVPEFQK